MKKLTLSKESLRVLTAQEAEQIAGAGYVPTRSPYECYSLQAACVQTARCPQTAGNCTISVSVSGP